MARKTNVSPLKAIPSDAKGYRPNSYWSKKGQKMAQDMANYLAAAMAVPEHKIPQIPRVMAYKYRLTRGGNDRLPMHANRYDDAVYYPWENFILLKIPKKEQKIKVKEYKFLASSPIIGTATLNRTAAFYADLAHEMAHWADNYLMCGGTRKKHHTRVFRMAYALLREKFVNQR